MVSIFIRHRVADFARWKPLFDDHETARREHGFITHSLHRDPDDPNVIVIAFRARDLGRAREFGESEELRSVMERAGVQGMPEMWFGEDVEEKGY